MAHDKIDNEPREEHNLPASTPMSAAEREKFVRMRMKLLDNSTDEELLFSALVQLRVRMEKYLDSSKSDLSFGHFLGIYCKLIGRKQKVIAEELSVHPTYLNRIINEKQQPNAELTYRLEAHSGNLISALSWFRLLHRSQENDLINNEKARKQQESMVKNRFRYG